MPTDAPKTPLYIDIDPKHLEQHLRENFEEQLNFSRATVVPARVKTLQDILNGLHLLILDIDNYRRIEFNPGHQYTDKEGTEILKKLEHVNKILKQLASEESVLAKTVPAKKQSGENAKLIIDLSESKISKTLRKKIANVVTQINACRLKISAVKGEKIFGMTEKYDSSGDQQLNLSRAIVVPARVKTLQDILNELHRRILDTDNYRRIEFNPDHQYTDEEGEKILEKLKKVTEILRLLAGKESILAETALVEKQSGEDAKLIIDLSESKVSKTLRNSIADVIDQINAYRLKISAIKGEKIFSMTEKYDSPAKGGNNSSPADKPVDISRDLDSSNNIFDQIKGPVLKNVSSESRRLARGSLRLAFATNSALSEPRRLGNFVGAVFIIVILTSLALGIFFLGPVYLPAISKPTLSLSAYAVGCFGIVASGGFYLYSLRFTKTLCAASIATQPPSGAPLFEKAQVLHIHPESKTSSLIPSRCCDKLPAPAAAKSTKEGKLTFSSTSKGFFSKYYQAGVKQQNKSQPTVIAKRY